jgi:hypothetical protein
MTVKELDFLVRQRTSDAEVVAEVQKRRLIEPLSAATLQALKQYGASEALVKAVSAPELVVTSEEAALEQQRQMVQKAQAAQALAEDAAGARRP